MLIAITSLGKKLNDPMDEHFGRAHYFIIYDTEKKTFLVHDNEQNIQAQQGAGIQAAQKISELGASVLITGDCGPKAFRVLEGNNVQIFRYQNGSVEEAIRAYQNRTLEQIKQPNK